MEQISNGNSGFVRNFAKTHPTASPGSDYQRIMNYFARMFGCERALALSL